MLAKNIADTGIYAPIWGKIRGEFRTCARPIFDTPSDLRFCNRKIGKNRKNAHTLRK